MSISPQVRRATGLGLGLAVTALAAFWLLKPPPPADTATVVSGSMAPTFLGPHYKIVCDDCQWPFACSVEQLPTDMALVCPLCGKRQSIESESPLPGDEVVIQRDEFLEQPPQRWRVVAFARNVDNTQRWEVKRLVGLPGESIGIHHGDIFVNGRPIKKSLQQTLAMAVTVHDSRYPTQEPKTPARWRPTLTRDQGAATDQLLLEYDHWRCIASPLPRSEPAPVMDSYGVNQALSRELNVVRDLIFECSVELPNAADLTMTMLVLGKRIQGRLSREESEATLSIDGMAVQAKSIQRSQATVVRLAFIDGRAIFEVDGAELEAPVSEPLDWQPATSPVNILLEGADQDAIDHLAIYRDIYYLNPNQTNQRWTIDLSANEYLVLGDNAPVSADGRNFGPIQRESFLGAVKKAP